MKKIIFKGVIVFLILLICTGVALAEEINLDQLLNKIAEQKNKLESYEAEIITEVEGPFIEEKQIQKAQVYYQDPDKTRTDTFAPIHQVALKVGEKALVIDALGNIQDLSSDNETGDKNSFSDPIELKEFVDFSLQDTPTSIILTGIPKNGTSGSIISKGKISKVVFHVDREKYVVTKAEIYSKDEALFMEIDVEYGVQENVYYPQKSKTVIFISPKVGQMKIVANYMYQHINQPISPEIFDPEKIKEQLQAQGDKN